MSCDRPNPRVLENQTARTDWWRQRGYAHSHSAAARARPRHWPTGQRESPCQVRRLPLRCPPMRRQALQPFGLTGREAASRPASRVFSQQARAALGKHHLRLADVDEIQVVLLDDLHPVLRSRESQRVVKSVEPSLGELLWKTRSESLRLGATPSVSERGPKLPVVFQALLALASTCWMRRIRYPEPSPEPTRLSIRQAAGAAIA